MARGAAAKLAHVDQALAALADPKRRSTIDLLRRRPRRAGELATALALSAPAMSRHLRVLRRSGLVEESGLIDDARVRVYQLRPEPFAALNEWLSEVRGFWTTQLDAFAAHAERVAQSRSVKGDK